jgi:hypothetical protein
VVSAMAPVGPEPDRIMVSINGHSITAILAVLAGLAAAGCHHEPTRSADGALARHVPTESEQRAAMEARRRYGPVEVRVPTVIGFCPASRPPLFRPMPPGSPPPVPPLFDTTPSHDERACQDRLATYRAGVEAAGFAYVARSSAGFAVVDMSANAYWQLPAAARDSTGVVLLAPGMRPLLRFGAWSPTALRDIVLEYRAAFHALKESLAVPTGTGASVPSKPRLRADPSRGQPYPQIAPRPPWHLRAGAPPSFDATSSQHR